jgi:hypothetical protein
MALVGQAFQPDGDPASNVSVGLQASMLVADLTRAHAMGWVPATCFDGHNAVSLERLTYVRLCA